MPKLSVRVETLEKQVSELLLKDKKREQQFQELFSQNKRLENQNKELSLQNEKIENQNKRLDSLEQQLEKTKSENLGKVANDFWYKYRSEVHKIYSRYYDIIFNNINNFLFWSVLISFVSLLWVVSYTNINKFPFIILIRLIFWSGAGIFIFPFITVFFQLKIYLQFKNPRNFIKILISIANFLDQSLTTFIIKFSFH